jgi:hypothetical protein
MSAFSQSKIPPQQTEGLLDLVGERLDLGAHTHVLPLMMMPARMAPAWISR